jgi:hypothetical protein
VNFAAFMHVPAAVGYLVGLAHFGGGLAILTGAFLRVGSVCVMIVMLGAIFLVHLPHGFDIGHGGYEFALSELLLAFGLLISGPGAWSLRNVCPRPSVNSRSVPRDWRWNMAHAFRSRKRTAAFRRYLHIISFSYHFHFPAGGNSSENVTGRQLGAWPGCGCPQCG